MSLLHEHQTVVHRAIAGDYADATARLAASGFAATDVEKLYRQLDDDSVWMLTDDDPITWAQVGATVDPVFATIETTDATPTILYEAEPAVGQVIAINGSILGQVTGGGNVGWYIILLIVNHDGGSFYVGADAAGPLYEDDAAWDVTFNETGTSLQVLVTGAAATSITWKLFNTPILLPSA